MINGVAKAESWFMGHTWSVASTHLNGHTIEAGHYLHAPWCPWNILKLIFEQPMQASGPQAHQAVGVQAFCVHGLCRQEASLPLRDLVQDWEPVCGSLHHSRMLQVLHACEASYVDGLAILNSHRNKVAASDAVAPDGKFGHSHVPCTICKPCDHIDTLLQVAFLAAKGPPQA